MDAQIHSDESPAFAGGSRGDQHRRMGGKGSEWERMDEKLLSSEKSVSSKKEKACNEVGLRSKIFCLST